MALELIIFDCDGVLVDSEIIANLTLSKLLNEYDYKISAAEARKRFLGLAIPSIIKEIQNEGFYLPDNFEKILFYRDEAAFTNQLKSIPGIKTTLSKIKLPMCVASSGSEKKIKTNLQNTNLIAHFRNNIFSAEMVKEPKPAPDLFLLAASTLRVHPKNCLVIEDSEAGIKGAKEAGMLVFGFSGGKHCDKTYYQKLEKSGANQTFNKMRKLPAMIANIR